MRCRIFAMVVCLGATAVMAQEKSVLVDDEDIWKQYTRPEVKVTDVNGNQATLGGVSIGTILNDQLYFGITGDILVDKITADDDSDIRLDRWDWWYAGAEVGYIFNPDSLVHLSVSSLFGGGQIEFKDTPDDDTDGFWIIEPGIQANINLSDTWEFGLGVSYRWTSDIDLDGVEEDDLTDVAFTAFFRALEF